MNLMMNSNLCNLCMMMNKEKRDGESEGRSPHTARHHQGSAKLQVASVDAEVDNDCGWDRIACSATGT